MRKYTGFREVRGVPQTLNLKPTGIGRSYIEALSLYALRVLSMGFWLRLPRLGLLVCTVETLTYTKFIALFSSP